MVPPAGLFINNRLYSSVGLNIIQQREIVEFMNVTLANIVFILFEAFVL